MSLQIPVSSTPMVELEELGLELALLCDALDMLRGGAFLFAVIEQALQHYREALELYTREGSPRYWALIHHNLGVLYTEMYERTGEARYGQQAEAAYQRALEVYTQEASPAQWATTQNNLATLYLAMYRRTGEARYARQAEAAHREALKVPVRKEKQEVLP